MSGMEINTSAAPCPRTARLDALLEVASGLAAVIEEELAALRRGDAAALARCHERKAALGEALEEAQRRLDAEPPEERERLLAMAREHGLAAAMERLRPLLARSEAALRGAGDALRQVFVGAARLRGAREELYGGSAPAGGEGGIFGSRTA